MKKIYIKIPAIIGLFLNVLGLGLFIYVLSSLNPEYRGTGLALLSICFLTAVVSLIFYFIDAILSIIMAIMKINPIFNIILASVIILPVVLLICCKQFYTGLLIVYYSIVFLLEIISIIKNIKQKRV